MDGDQNGESAERETSKGWLCWRWCRM